MSRVSETNGGGVPGFQLPLGRREEFDEALRPLGEARVAYLVARMAVRPGLAEGLLRALDGGGPVGLREAANAFLEEEAVRALVRARIPEVVRKKAGGGGYVLYAPNRGKKKPPHHTAEFPTKLQAKQAQLARFPPKELGKLKRLRKEIDRLRKDPKKRDDAEKRWAKEPSRPKRRRAEGIERLREAVASAVREGLFREEVPESRWDEYVSRLSKAAVESDRRLQSLSKRVEKAAEHALRDAFVLLRKSLKRAGVAVEGGDVKKDESKKKTYLAFEAEVDGVGVGPIYVFVEDGVPKIELSAEARASMTKATPEGSKRLRAELVSAEQDGFEKITAARDASAARDKYLAKIEGGVDEYLADLSELERAVLKTLLSRKYRGK